MANKASGMVGANAALMFPPTPLNMKNVKGLPINPYFSGPMLSPKARLNPKITHIMLRLLVFTEDYRL